MLPTKFLANAGCDNDIEFWSKYSGAISSEQELDHMVAALSKNGYIGTPGDKYQSWLADMANNRGTARDNESAISDMPSGLTFYKNYQNGGNGSLNANLSVGVGVATYTATRAASTPATYVDNNGVVQGVTSSNTPRYQGGYYDATGFHSQKGLLIESASTNLVTKANNIEDAIWTATNITADNDDSGSSSPDGTATAPSLTASANNGTFLLAAGVTAQTYSVWLKRKTGSGSISITADSGATYTEITVLSTWARFSVTATSASQTCGVKIAVDTDAVYIWGNQFEYKPYATSYIPTVGASLTRNAESLSYLLTGNRTVQAETIFIKCSPESVFANDNTYRIILDNDPANHRRRLMKFNNTDKVSIIPQNGTGGCAAVATSVLAANTSYVVGGIVYGATAATNVSIFVNGTVEASDTDNFTNNSWSGSFFLGLQNGEANNYFNGVFQAVAFFNRALTENEVAIVTNILNQ